MPAYQETQQRIWRARRLARIARRAVALGLVDIDEAEAAAGGGDEFERAVRVDIDPDELAAPA